MHAQKCSHTENETQRSCTARLSAPGKSAAFSSSSELTRKTRLSRRHYVATALLARGSPPCIRVHVNSCGLLGFLHVLRRPQIHDGTEPLEKTNKWSVPRPDPPTETTRRWRRG